MRRQRKLWQFLLVMIFLVAAAASMCYTHPIWVTLHFFKLRLLATGTESHEVQIDGHRIHYYVKGPAANSSNVPTVVLIHGLGGKAEDWINLAPYLVRAGYRVYSPDLLGYGQSEQPSSATYSISEQAELVTHFFDAMHLQQTDLVGWSMGGWIVQKVAANHPERIRRLVLVDSAGLRLAPDWDTRLFTPSTPAQLHQLYALLMPIPPAVPLFVEQDILRQTQKNGWVVKRAVASMLSGKDVTDHDLPTLKMPVLILWGDQDRIVPLSEGQIMHKLIPQSRLAIAPACGHLAPEQCAPMYGPALTQFLQANPPLPASEEILHNPI